MALPDIIYEGSVKNVRGKEGKTPYIFEYSDRYSIFDWGQMPDELKNKGESLAFLAWFFFNYLRGKGFADHMAGLVDTALKPVSVDGARIVPSKFLQVQSVEVLKPQSETQDGKLTWNYSAYKSRPVNALVPLEVIFRFGVPEGSSLLKRTASPEYCREIGLTHEPKTGDTFSAPIIEFSTKLENKDRYISRAEACDIAGLSETEMKKLHSLAARAALALKECVAGLGIELWDGKFEFAFTQAGDAREFMLVDSIGPDELRLTVNGIHLSKEMLRAHYKGSHWLSALEKAKALGDARCEKDWKRICMEELHAAPERLPQAVKEKAEMIYMTLSEALCRKYLAKSIFPDAWTIPQIVSALEGIQRKTAA